MSTKPNASAGEIAEILLPVRRDGWTQHRQAGFLRALAATHNVSAAAREVGMTRQSAYKLRARLKGGPFDYGWDAAFQSSFDALAEVAMDRALNGVEVPHFHRGELVGTSRRFDERLTVALLAMRASIRRPRPPLTHAASCYDADDFQRLVDRVEHGPETWDGYPEPEEPEPDEEVWVEEQWVEERKEWVEVGQWPEGEWPGQGEDA